MNRKDNQTLKFVRFVKNGKTESAVVEGEQVRLINGSVFDGYEATDVMYRLSEIKLLPPTVPSKIVCVAHNYRGLIKQIGESLPEEPIIFLKPPSCLIGHEDPVTIPADAERVIFEGELAVIIKDRMKHVSRAEALSHVAGYSCFNDVTERAMIERDHFMLTLGKSMDTFGPCGPVMVSGIDPNRLEISTRVNGVQKQHDNTGTCIFSVEFLLEYISKRITLYPGDIVTTGTPQGVDTLLPEDVVEVKIEHIGTLRNRVRAESSADE